MNYNSKKYQLTLKNSDSDYGKNLKINLKKIEKNNKSKFLEIPFNDLTKKFKGYSRIFLTSRIIKKVIKGVSKRYKIKNLKKFQYNEYILHCLSRSVKKKKSILVL